MIGAGWVALYALSAMWSANLGAWNNHFQTKLPIIMLPLAYACMPPMSRKYKEIFTVGMVVILVIAALYSIGCFINDPEFYIREYKVSHMLPTLPKQDHIRSSIASTLCILWCVYYWPELSNKRVKWIVGIGMFVLALFVHVLAAKSGLIAFYLFALGWAVYLAIIKRKLAGWLILLAVPVILWVASWAVPTLRERIEYITFTIFMYQHKHDTSNLGDVSRLVSYDLGLQLVKQNMWKGVGAGDMKDEMDKLYVEQHPKIDEYGRLLPHNQFLTVALGCGIPAMVLFGVWFFRPLISLRRNRASYFFAITWLILLMQLMIEPVLEVQYGVFVVLFFLLLQYNEIIARPKTSDL